MRVLRRIAGIPLLLVASVALANGAPWIDGQQFLRAPSQRGNAFVDEEEPKTASTRREDRIAIESETVDVRLDVSQAVVQVDYTLRNLTGASLEFPMAFPGEGYLLDDGIRHPPISSLQAFNDGNPLRVTPARTKDGTWHVWQLQAPADRRFHVRILYKVPCPDRFDYVLRTGALWRGPIGRLEFRVRWAEDGERAGKARVSIPAQACREDGAIRWRWTMIEPDQDLHVCLGECDAGSRTRPVAEVRRCAGP